MKHQTGRGDWSRVVTYLCKLFGHQNGMEDVLQGCGDTCWSGSFCTAYFLSGLWGPFAPTQMMPLLISLQSLCATFPVLVVCVYHSIFIQILVMGSKMQARNLEWIIACQSHPEITVLVITQFQLHTIDAESMGGDGGDRPRGQKVVGRCPQVVPEEFCYVVFETVKCTLKILIYYYASDKSCADFSLKCIKRSVWYQSKALVHIPISVQ